MDDRRRTISSEENMIGEALMRVSNTLEAERLTKSLDYQEKLRSRANIRLIIAVCCLIIACLMLLIGGIMLIVLLKYEDPVLDTLIPFLKGFFNGVNTMFQSSVEASTYLPALTRLGTEALGIGVNALNALNSMDLSSIMGYLTSMLGTTAGLLSDTRGTLSSLSSQMSPMLSQLTASMSDLTNGGLAQGISSGITDTVSALGINMKDVASTNNALVHTLSSVANTVNSTVGSPEAQQAAKSLAGATSNVANSSADLLQNLNTATAAFNNNVDYATLGEAAGKTASAGASIANTTADLMNGAATVLNSITSIFS